MEIRENTIFVSQGGHPGFVFTAGFCSRSEHPDPTLCLWQQCLLYLFFLPPLWVEWGRGCHFPGSLWDELEIQRRKALFPLSLGALGIVPKTELFKTNDTSTAVHDRVTVGARVGWMGKKNPLSSFQTVDNRQYNTVIPEKHTKWALQLSQLTTRREFPGHGTEMWNLAGAQWSRWLEEAEPRVWGGQGG